MSLQKLIIPNPNQGQKPEELFVQLEQRAAPNPATLARKLAARSAENRKLGLQVIGEKRQELLAVLEALGLGDGLYIIDYFSMQFFVWKTKQGTQVYDARFDNLGALFAAANTETYTRVEISD